MKNALRNLELVNLKGRENLGDTVVDGRKIKADLRVGSRMFSDSSG